MALNTAAETPKGQYLLKQSEPPALSIGSTFGECWIIVRLIGSGGFGSVYEVSDGVEGGKKSSLKVQHEAESSLLTEVRVLKKLEHSAHACKIFSWGQIGSLKFIIMSLLGNDLSVLRELAPGNKFSLSTTLRVGCQMIEAIRDVHEVGYIHRDIKPENFAIGYQCDLIRTIYILDFGLSRRYRSRRGNVRRPRPCPGFNGTTRYASIYAHCNMEQGRRDDLIAMFYTIVEIYLGTLPWEAFDDDNLTCLAIKRSLVLEKRLANAPRAFLKVKDYLSSLEYADRPDYDWLMLQLQLAMQQYGLAS
uniref:Protein kinase domain-containing protein n=1 Tax=Trichuris muris TaxID=70415 RepID=A0A5S6QIZ7_TRIMR